MLLQVVLGNLYARQQGFLEPEAGLLSAWITEKVATAKRLPWQGVGKMLQWQGDGVAESI